MQITRLLLILVLFYILCSCSESPELQSIEPIYETSNIDKMEMEIALPIHSFTQNLASSSNLNTFAKGNVVSPDVEVEMNNKNTNFFRPSWDTIQYGQKVDLYRELVSLFDSDNFDCGCDEKLKKKLKKIKPSNKQENESGYIPIDVLNNALYNDTAILFRGSGSNYLAHSFRYIPASGQITKLLFADNSPTIQNFKETSFIESNSGVHDHFFYTLDCSGFLSAALAVTAGVDKNSMKASAEGASKIDRSLLVIGGVMYSPLYQAYNGSGVFSGSDSVTLKNRMKSLEAILQAIPEQDHNDSVKIIINSNFRVVLTSNTGSSGFNGKATLGINGGFGYVIGGVDVQGNSEGKIDRTSNFTNYKTYMTELNVGSIPSNITVGSVKEKVRALRAQL